MDDQRDYAEEAANRAMLHEEGISELVEEWADKLIKKSEPYKGSPHGHFVRNGIFEMDIEFPDMRYACAFEFMHETPIPGATVALRDTVDSLHNPVILIITKKLANCDVPGCTRIH